MGLAIRWQLSSCGEKFSCNFSFFFFTKAKLLIPEVLLFLLLKIIKMEKLNRNIIISRLIRNEKIIKQFGVVKVGLFGSYLSGIQNDQSDIDILIEFRNDKNNYDNFINLCFLLDELFQGRKVDVVTKNSLSPYIGPKILQQVEYVPFSD